MSWRWQSSFPVLRQFFQTSLKTASSVVTILSLLLLPSIMRENAVPVAAFVGVPARWVLPLTLYPLTGPHTLHGHPFEHFITPASARSGQRSGRRRLGACGNPPALPPRNSLNSQAISRDKPTCRTNPLQRTAKRGTVKIQVRISRLGRCHSSCNARQSWRFCRQTFWDEDQAGAPPAW